MNNGQPIHREPAFAGRSQLPANRWIIFIASQRDQLSALCFENKLGITEETNRPQANVFIRMLQKLFHCGIVETAADVKCPE